MFRSFHRIWYHHQHFRGSDRRKSTIQSLDCEVFKFDHPLLIQTLKLLASAARTGERLESLKPPVTNLDFQGAAVNEDGTEIQIVLDRYRSRPRANQDGQASAPVALFAHTY